MPDLNAPSSGLSTGLAHPDGNRLKNKKQRRKPRYFICRCMKCTGYFERLDISAACSVRLFRCPGSRRTTVPNRPIP